MATMTGRAVRSLVGAVAALALLSGCAMSSSPRATVLPPDDAPAQSQTLTVRPTAPTGGATPTGAPTIGPDAGFGTAVACLDGLAAISGEGGNYVLGDDCGRVEVSGEGIAVVLSGAVSSLVVRGERIVVEAGALTDLAVEGQGSAVTSGAVGSVAVRGDRNTVTSGGEIGTVTVSGGGNTVQGTRVGSTQISGDGNMVRDA